jgi:hypothetical protein
MIRKSIYNLLYPENTVCFNTLPTVIKTLEKVYGQYLLARILKCRIGMLKRIKENKGMLTVEQISMLNFMLKIEELITKDKTANAEKNPKR